MDGDRRQIWMAWTAFYLMLLGVAIVVSIAAGYHGDLFWLVIGWMIVLGLITRVLALRPPRTRQ
ncbi:MAG: hypothetical protein M3P18_06130 [Actinomycetota bacterium]|nr:hypothetical protein [Actinomycetota bacterium]